MIRASASVRIDPSAEPSKQIARIEREIANVVVEQSNQMRDYIRAKMREPKTGRVYTRPGGRKHRASAWGEFPAVDTGNLFKSLKIRFEDQRMKAVIGSDVPYGKHLDDPDVLNRRMSKPTVEVLGQVFISAVRWRLANMSARV